MGTFSIWHWLIVGIIVLLLFGGGGKIPKLMRDVGQGINSFKKGLKETKEEEPAEEAVARKTIEGDPSPKAETAQTQTENTAAKG